MAEDKRFELLRQLPTYTLSKGAHSTTMRILQTGEMYRKERKKQGKLQ